MEIVVVECICKSCGNAFTVQRECHNMLAAELLEEKLQRRRKPICPSCFKKEKHKMAIERAAQLCLPEIIGNSKNQITYAVSLRDEFITKHPSQISKAKQELEKIRYEKVPIVAQKHGMESDTCIAEAFRRIGLYKAYICISEINASFIIEVLKQQ